MDQPSNPRICELIRTNPGYSAQVDLNLWFPDNARNLATMRRYSPTVAHRRAFEQVAGSLDSKDKRVYLITGNYGTGKSHLCLMLANYLAYPSSQPDVARFLDNYAQQDEAAAQQLRARRRKGSYLVALCDYDTTDDFGEVVLRAVLSALQGEGLADLLETPFAEARRKLEQLERERQSGGAPVDYFGFYEQRLPQHLPGVTMKAFKEKLYPGLDRSALEIFRKLHQEIHRSPFSYEAGNLSAILRSTLASPAFRERFEGIVVFWDEFGYTLASPSRLSLNVFQQFAQLCSDYEPTRGKLIFVATAHRDFVAYAPAWAAADYNKISDRVTPVNLLPEGLEDVIGAIVTPDRAHPAWQSEVLPQAGPIWSQWVAASRASGIFEPLATKPPLFRAKILEGVYPLHPMATYAVIQLAREVASQNRTVFTFFSSEKEEQFEDGSYLWYIHEFPIARADGRLSFYTVDRLFDYFRARLRTDSPDLAPRARERVAHYEAAATQLQRARNLNPLELSDVSLIDRLLRTILIYDLISVEPVVVHASLDNLLFGLDMQPADRPALVSQLDELVRFSVLHRNPVTGLYEFRRSDLFDVTHAVEEYKRDPANTLGSLADELTSLAPLPKRDQYLAAKAYNAQYMEDKRLLRCIVTPGDLATAPVLHGVPATYFDLLELQVSDEVAKDGDYEGIALYVICESQAEIARARDLAAKNTSARVVIAIPNSPVELRDALLNVKAIQSVRAGPEAPHFSTQDSALVADREAEYGRALEKLRDQLLDSRRVTWLGAYGAVLPVDPAKPDDVATRVMQKLYTRRPNFSHDDFNLTHDVRNFARKHQSLLEAVNALLRTGTELVIDSRLADNRGEIRYLQRCLYQHGALAPVRHQGTATVVELQRALDKFEPDLPALADMIREVRALKAGEHLLLRTFVQKYRQHPYGLGDIALVILLAALLRYFGDTIKIKRDDAMIGDLDIADYDVVADIIKGNYPNAFIQYREIRPGERDLIIGVYGLFTAAIGAAQPAVTAGNAYDSVVTWFDALPPVAKVTEFHQDPESVPALRFLSLLERVHALDPHALVLGELQTVAGYDAAELVTPERAAELLEALRTAKERIESTPVRVEGLVREGLCQIFSVEGHTWEDLADAVRAWYNALDSHQRSQAAKWHSDASKPLVQLFVDLSDCRRLFLEELPARPGYNFRPVRDWNTNLIRDYLGKLQEGLGHVEKNRIKVTPPSRTLIGEHQEETEGDVRFSGPLVLQLSHSDPKVRVYVTDSGAEPQRSPGGRTEFCGSQELDIARLARSRHGRVTIQYVAQDEDGNWGVVQRLDFLDEAHASEIHQPQQRALHEGAREEPVRFIFPTTEPALVRALSTFFESALDAKLVHLPRLRALVQEILDALSTKAGE